MSQQLTFRTLHDDIQPPVLAAWGAGVDSTAMLIELIARGERIDAALFADPGGEHPETYAFVPVFCEYLAAHGVRVETVRYECRDFKNWPPYRTLEENCLTNGTLPSIAFGFSACSQKWKIAPQNRWAEQWPPAQRAWAARLKVVKLIGYDCSPADAKRYAEREGHTDERYTYRYPLREWGWIAPAASSASTRPAFPFRPSRRAFTYVCTNRLISMRGADESGRRIARQLECLN